MAPGKRKVDVSQLRIPVDTWRKVGPLGINLGDRSVWPLSRRVSSCAHKQQERP
jgi:hypothetical protein